MVIAKISSSVLFGTRPKQLDVPTDERKKYPEEMWEQIAAILSNASKDVVNSFLALALSRSVAGGPKVFQPTNEDCEALENTACTMAFEDYKQPYPVVIIEFPAEYRKHLAEVGKLKKAPSHVIVHHEPSQGFITINAFFDRDNILSQIIPARPEYKTIEDAITKNKDRPDQQGDDFRNCGISTTTGCEFLHGHGVAGCATGWRIGPIALR